MACPLCGENHNLSSCPRWKYKPMKRTLSTIMLAVLAGLSLIACPALAGDAKAELKAARAELKAAREAYEATPAGQAELKAKADKARAKAQALREKTR